MSEISDFLFSNHMQDMTNKQRPKDMASGLMVTMGKGGEGRDR